MLYCHINKFNKKKYFGITKTNIHKRYVASNGYRGCTLFHNAIKKYGWDNFEHIIVLDSLSREQAEKAEICAISIFDTTNPRNGYNIRKGGLLPGELSEKGYKRLVDAASGANSPRALPVVAFDLNGQKIGEYVTISEAQNVYRTSIIRKNSNRYSRAINGAFFRLKSIVHDANMMDEDDLTNSPLTLPPKNTVSPLARAIAVFDRSTGNRVEILPRLSDVQTKYKTDSSKMHCKGIIVSEKYVFKYADDVQGFDSLDLSFLNVPRTFHSKPVNQYDANGNLLRTYPSLRKASDSTKLSYKSMSLCALHRTMSCGGFVWRYVDDPVQFEKPKSCTELRKERKHYKYRPIDQIDLHTGKVIRTFESLTEAANAYNVSKSSIYSVAHHIKNCVSAAGYGWQYHEVKEGVG